MRLLHIDTGAEMRGGQYQVLLLLKALREEGHHSTLLARQNAPLRLAALQDGFDVRPAGIRMVWQMSSQVDLVHAHDARAHTLAALACRGKFVVSRRVAFPVRRSIASRWKYQRASRFIAVSQFVAKELAAAGVEENKIDVVYDAVAITNNAVWDTSYPAVALASRDPQKGRDLVESAALIAAIPVTFSDDLQRDLQSASMFVYVTRSEGLGSAVLLAMSAGVPVIASHVGGLTEIFEDGRSGIFVANDVQEIASAMRKIKAQAHVAHELIQGARQQIADRFTVAHLLEGTLASYRRALDH